MARHSTATRNGASVSVQRMFGICRDCGGLRLLVGYLCKGCYGNRDKRRRYAVSAEYRERCIERAARNRRERHGKN